MWLRSVGPPKKYRVIQNFHAPREKERKILGSNQWAPFKVHLNRKRLRKFGCQKLKSEHFRAMFENGLFLWFYVHGTNIQQFLPAMLNFLFLLVVENSLGASMMEHSLTALPKNFHSPKIIHFINTLSTYPLYLFAF